MKERVKQKRDNRSEEEKERDREVNKMNVKKSRENLKNLCPEIAEYDQI